MYARQTDDLAVRLHELHVDEWEHLVMGGLGFGLAMLATQLAPSLVLPLMVGGLAGTALAIRDLWRRWDLVDRLSGDRSALAIPEVRAYAMREATVPRRHRLAGSIRSYVETPIPTLEERTTAASGDLLALADELDDERFVLDPALAVACSRLVTDSLSSSLLNPARPAEELHSRVHEIRAGFRLRETST